MAQNLFETLLAFVRSQSVETYFVGGSVRDRLLGRPNHDVDLGVRGNASNLARAFADQIGAAFFVMDETFDQRAAYRDPAHALQAPASHPPQQEKAAAPQATIPIPQDEGGRRQYR